MMALVDMVFIRIRIHNSSNFSERDGSGQNFLFFFKKETNCFNSLLVVLALVDILFITFTTFDYAFARGTVCPLRLVQHHWLVFVEYKSYIQSLGDAAPC